MSTTATGIDMNAIDDQLHEQLRINIETKTNPLHFKQCKVEDFKTSFARDLRVLIDNSKSSDYNSRMNGDDSNTCTGNTCTRSNDVQNIYHYNANFLQTFLFPSLQSGNDIFTCAIQWENICLDYEQHSKHCSRNNNSTSIKSDHCCHQHQQQEYHAGSNSTTALENIVQVILNQSIVPSCLTNTIIIGLLSVMKYMTESQSSFCIHYQSRIQRILRLSINEEQPQQQTLLTSLNYLQSTIVHLMTARPNFIITSYLIESFISNYLLVLPSNEEMSKMKFICIESSTCKSSIITCYKLLKSVIRDNLTEKQLSMATEMIIFIYHLINHNKYVVSPLTSMVRSLLYILRKVDDIDVLLLQYQRKKKNRLLKSKQHKKIKSEQLCIHCEKIFCNFKQKQKTFTSQQHHLHDEMSDNELDQYTVDLRRKMKRNKVSHNDEAYTNIGSISLKDVLGTTSSSLDGVKMKHSSKTVTCYLCPARMNKSSHQSRQNITTLPIEVIYFRAFVHHMILKVLVCPSSSLLFHNQVSDVDKLLYMASSMTIQHYNSSSIRYCALLIIHHLGVEYGYKQYLHLLLQHYQRNFKHFILKVYIEIVTECITFDDPDLCWGAIQDLIALAISLNEQKQQKIVLTRNGSKSSQHQKEMITYLLQCAGYLILKRNKYFFNGNTNNNSNSMSNEMSSSFHKYVIKCSEMFNNTSEWIHPSLTPEEQYGIVLALQKLGILSFLDCNYDCVEENKNGEKMSTLSYIDGIKEFHKRIGPKNQGPVILSDHTNMMSMDNNCNSPMNQFLTPSKRKHHEDGFDEELSIQEYVNEDIIRLIFQFLGYKRLVRATAVCKEWNRIANENVYWERHYRKRFKILLKQDLLPDEGTFTIDHNALAAVHENESMELKHVSWRRLFDDKWKKEASLRSRPISRDGFKVRTCHVLGCLTVISTSAHKDRHEEMHKKQAMKQIDRYTKQLSSTRKVTEKEKDQKSEQYKNLGIMPKINKDWK